MPATADKNRSAGDLAGSSGQPIAASRASSCAKRSVSGTAGLTGGSGEGSIRLPREQALPAIVVMIVALVAVVIGGVPLVDPVLNAGQG